jgi:hypothetical protein
VTPCIEGLLEIAHVCILFGVNARIRKQHRKITIGDKESQLEGRVGAGMKAYSMKNFILAGLRCRPQSERQEEERELSSFAH